MKRLEKVIAVIVAIFCIWTLLSWVDVLAHNSPVDGDYNYSPVNIFVMLGENYK